jgi:hypothetical protein
MKNKMVIDFLEDGRLKIDTGDMSGPLHKQADDFLVDVARDCGGKAAQKRKPGHARHTHTHNRKQEA